MAATLLYRVEGSPFESEGQVVLRYKVDLDFRFALGDPTLPAIGSSLTGLFAGSPLYVVSRRISERGPGVTFVDVIYASRATSYGGVNPDDPDSNIIEFGEDYSFEVVEVPLVKIISFPGYSVGGLDIPASRSFAEQFKEHTVNENSIVVSKAVSSWTFVQRAELDGKAGKLWTIGGKRYRLEGANVTQLGAAAWKVTYTLTTQNPLFVNQDFFTALAGQTNSYVVPDAALFPMLPFERLYVRFPEATQGLPPLPVYTKSNTYVLGQGQLTLPGIPAGFFTP